MGHTSERRKIRRKIFFQKNLITESYTHQQYQPAYVRPNASSLCPIAPNQISRNLSIRKVKSPKGENEIFSSRHARSFFFAHLFLFLIPSLVCYKNAEYCFWKKFSAVERLFIFPVWFDRRLLNLHASHWLFPSTLDTQFSICKTIFFLIKLFFRNR